MKAIARWSLSVLLLALMIAQPALAYNYPLSSEAIREAYFLAKENPDKRQAFFEAYRHNLPVPKTGADVALIEVETPFACLVEAIARTPMTYHAPDAQQDYLGKLGQFRVHAEIYFTATYPKATDTAASLGEFWRDFQVHLKQDAEIQPLSVHGKPIHNHHTIGGGYVGAIIDGDYDVAKIDSGAPTTIEVDTPDGQQVETTFLLNTLR
jgi:hypothetical protein